MSPVDYAFCRSSAIASTSVKHRSRHLELSIVRDAEISMIGYIVQTFHATFHVSGSWRTKQSDAHLTPIGLYLGRKIDASFARSLSTFQRLKACFFRHELDSKIRLPGFWKSRT